MKLQKALPALNAGQLPAERISFITNVDDRAFLIVTLLYIVTVISLPLYQPARTLLYAVYPILMAPVSGTSFLSVLKKSLIVLPFILMLGIFNPIYDTNIAFFLGGTGISFGWLSFITLTLRGLLCVQALIILVNLAGFIGINNSLRSLGMPKALCVQLMLINRYIRVLIEEVITMQQSIKSRGYGRNSMPLKMWTGFVGSLLLRTFERSKRLHNAMLSRGFDGFIPMGSNMNWNLSSSIYLSSWIVLFAVLYFFNISSFLSI